MGSSPEGRDGELAAIRTIVVGIDGSPGAAEALRFALEEADVSGAAVTAVTAWDVPPGSYGAPNVRRAGPRVLRGGGTEPSRPVSRVCRRSAFRRRRGAAARQGRRPPRPLSRRRVGGHARPRLPRTWNRPVATPRLRRHVLRTPRPMPCRDRAAPAATRRTTVAVVAACGHAGKPHSGRCNSRCLTPRGTARWT